jgi:NTP pyrophosphatase (non-canonical NTP hydrolase)
MIRDDIKRKILEFRSQRDWERFHTPKNLAISLVLEASELLENFQWKKDGEIADMLQDKHDCISDEIADIVIYLTYLCHDLKIDIEKAVGEKIEKNNRKYPAGKVRGSARKYNEY